MCKVSLEEVKSALPRVRKDQKMMEGPHMDPAGYDDETEMVSTRADRPARHDQQMWPEGSGGDRKGYPFSEQHKPEDCWQDLGRCKPS